jgi:hypothetical protein
MIRTVVLTLALALSATAVQAQDKPALHPAYMELPSGLREWFRNPDG